MTSEAKTWESLKAEYLHQVEKALSSVRHPRKREVLEDVRSHLDRRFVELKPDEQIWENFQAIITEMGPASDYAELLESDTVQRVRPVPLNYLLWIGLVVIVIIGAIIYLNRGDYNAWIEPRQKGHVETKTIIPKVHVGDYTFDMTKDDVLQRLGEPDNIMFGGEQYTLDNLPEEYYMQYDHLSFRIHDNAIQEITVLSPNYKFTNGLGVGDSERKIKQAFGNDFHLRETERRDYLVYKDQGLVFEIHKDSRAIMEINVTRGDHNGG